MASENDVQELGRDNHVAGPGFKNVLDGGHYFCGLHLCGLGKRHVHGHRVAVEGGIVGGAHEGMHLYSVSFDEDRAERLDALSVQRRRAVQEHVFVLDSLFKYRPDLRCFIFNQPSGPADVVCKFSLE